MDIARLAPAEAHFADLIWQHAPLPSGTLALLAAQQLQWKRTTAYTVLKRLCDRGLFENRDGVVYARISRADYDAAQSHRVVQEQFGGSLPAFVAAFSRREKLSDAQIAELQTLIDAMRE